MLSHLTDLVRRASRNCRGNVLMLFGLALIPLTFATGMGIDYARAMRLQNKLDAAADAAALSAVSRIAMNQGQSRAELVRQYAMQVFIAQTQGLVGAGGLSINYYDTNQFNIALTDTNSANSSTRLVTVSYRAQSANAFGGIFGPSLASLTIKGTSQTTASTAPNIDFYVMMDTSPSMLLPATTDGLNKMKSLNDLKCTFACHQSNLVFAWGSNDELQCTDSTRTRCKDYYSLAVDANITLRSDVMNKAVQDLTGTAMKIATANNATYRMGIEDFDYTYRTIWPKSQNSGYWVDTDLNRVKSHVADSTVLVYCQNNQRVCGVNDADTATRQSAAFQAVNTIIPRPGTGLSDSTPQNVLFVITDGMRDETRSDGKPEVAFDTAACTTLKNKGTRIAILYTEYLPESIAGNFFATDPNSGNVYNRLPQIEPTLQSCASTGLYYKVTTDDDISAALAQLFQSVVASARIVR